MKRALWVLLGISGLLAACTAGVSNTEVVPDAEVVLSTEEAVPAQESEATKEAEPEPTVVPDPDLIVVHNGMLIDGLGGEPVMDAVVVIEDGVIIAVGPEGDLEIPAGATMIDAQGGTIMPGIINARASLLLRELPLVDGEIDSTALRLFLRSPLRGGVTTMREAGGLSKEMQPDLMVFREVLDAYGNSIPTIVIASPGLMHIDSNIYEIYNRYHIGVETVEDARQATEDLIAFGVDQILYEQAIPPDTRAQHHFDSRVGLSPEQQVAVIEIAHEQGLWVLAQAVYPEDVAAAIAAGVDELAIWPLGDGPQPLPDDLIQSLVDNDISVISGFTIVRPYQGDARRFIDAGGRVVLGTIAPNSSSLRAFPDEMQLMLEVGEMTPMEIILAATANAAQAVGLGDQTGTLEVGKEADVIVVYGNPLEDIQALRRVTVVINNGEVIVGLSDD